MQRCLAAGLLVTGSLGAALTADAAASIAAAVPATVPGMLRVKCLGLQTMIVEVASSIAAGSPATNAAYIGFCY